MLVLPTTVILDWILKGYILPWQAFVGVAGILVGFFILVFSEYWELRRGQRVAAAEIKDGRVLAITSHNPNTSVNTATPHRTSFKSFFIEYLI